MKEDISEVLLERLFEVDLDIEQIDEFVDVNGIEPPPVIVFLLPGIRSDRNWAYALTHKAHSPTARTIIPEIITGPKDLGLPDLALRMRLNCFRNDFKEQILKAIVKHTAEHGRVDVIFVCHSMGSALFADIFESLKHNLSENGQAELKYIVFLGSVSLRTKNIVLGQNCNFINDVGQKDVWPVAAWFINPWKYDPVGRFGFGRAMVRDRIFPQNNHTSCTNLSHMEGWVLPIVEDGIVKVPEYQSKPTPYNIFQVIHKGFWLVISLMVGYVIWRVVGLF